MPSAKEKICEALLGLMSQKKIEDIRVKELIEEAGINRSSYYYYFGNIKDVLDYMSNQMVENMQQLLALAAPEKGGTDYECAVETAPKKGLAFFCFLYDNRRVYYTLMKSAYREEMCRKVIACFRAALCLSEYYYEDSDGMLYTLTEEEKDIRYNMMAYQLLGVIEAWSNHNFQQPPQEMAEMVYYIYRKKWRYIRSVTDRISGVRPIGFDKVK